MDKSYILLFLFLITISVNVWSQQADSINFQTFSIHMQTTVINQFKPSFTAAYSGENSLKTGQESKTSLTSTLYMGARLWKGASLFINPEIAGGSGLSEALGIAAATNGETFRIGNPSPQIYIARLYYRQIIDLNRGKKLIASNYFHHHSDFNQLDEDVPIHYVSLTIGKIGAADYFDDNSYSHDPRTQFMSWALMDNGAWDYPANTRGYTPSIVLEYVTPIHEIRYGFSLMPQVANGNDMNWDIPESGAHTIEYTHNHTIHQQSGAFRFLAFYNKADMGNYTQSLIQRPLYPDIICTRKTGNTKYGFGINAEQNITKAMGCFFRASWNDGKNETWAFTEIDHSLSFGMSLKGLKWHRVNDNVGFAYVVSGISAQHRTYLKAGGKGFMLGDGNLNYGQEHLAELYYSTELIKNHMFVSGAYQFLVNPGFNADRSGPVSIFSVRVHTRI